MYDQTCALPSQYVAEDFNTFKAWQKKHESCKIKTRLTEACLDAACMLDVRSAAQINQGPTSVHCRCWRINAAKTISVLCLSLIFIIPLVDDAQLELVVLEHLKQVRFGHFQALEDLLILQHLYAK